MVKIYKNNNELFLGEYLGGSLFGITLSDSRGNPRFSKIRIKDTWNWELYEGEIKIITETKIPNIPKYSFVTKTYDRIFFYDYFNGLVYYQSLDRISEGINNTTSYMIFISHIKTNGIYHHQLIFKNRYTERFN